MTDWHHVDILSLLFTIWDVTTTTTQFRPYLEICIHGCSMFSLYGTLEIHIRRYANLYECVGQCTGVAAAAHLLPMPQG